MNKSILEILIERFKNEITLDLPFIIATTVNEKDDNIQTICEKEKVNCYRGPEDDVLLRFIQVSEKFDFNYIIRVCADNPLFDIQGTSNLLDHHNSTGIDYLGYKVKDGKPSILSHLGFWGELVSVDALKKAHSFTRESFYREHVTNFIYGNPKLFEVALVEAPDNIGNRDDVRLTVDTQADFDMLKDIYANLLQQNISIDPKSIIDFLDDNSFYLEMMKKQIELNKK